MDAPAIRPDRQALLDQILREAQDLGFIGPGPLAPHLAHSLAFARLLARAWGWRAEGRSATVPALRRVVDLGSGGGLPGLVLALCFPQTRFVLIEAGERRAAHLDAASRTLGDDVRVQVVCERAESAGRRADLRGAFGAVVARAFGPPAVTAECAAPFLEEGGLLVVSDPPGVDAATRWPEDGLAKVGMVRVLEPASEEAGHAGQAGQAAQAGCAGCAGDSGPHFVVCSQVVRCPTSYPRRTGVPRKRPLFSALGSATSRDGRARGAGRHAERG